MQLDGSFHADATTGYNPQLDVQALLAMPALSSICPVSCQVDRCISFVFTRAEGAEEGAEEGALEIAPGQTCKQLGCA